MAVFCPACVETAERAFNPRASGPVSSVMTVTLPLMDNTPTPLYLPPSLTHPHTHTRVYVTETVCQSLRKMASSRRAFKPHFELK